MKFYKKLAPFYTLEIGLIPLSTNKKLPIRAQLGVPNTSLSWSSQCKYITYFFNYKSIAKKLGKYSRNMRTVRTCPICRIKHIGHLPIFVGKQKFTKIFRRFEYLDFTDHVIIKHNKQDHILLFCSPACKEIYKINPLGYDLTNMYGK